ncbi:hypothetical protein H4P12_03600 [Paracoccus sp. 11-3]|uniref:DUF1127 domain-containing protein n=1 Tax=Paracoccus amoyensis TaxID=2760093 RepID=A0A926JBG2_9RHOB|nr:hypothetical protein [Paracoccus amoyensis]MBC9245815.1 hypothetical protein [Paracoccus amoyensis]
MTTATLTAKNNASFLQLISAPFRAFGRFMIHTAETSPYARKLNDLNLTSDEELAARGTNRVAEIRRIVGPISSM